ncbi:MAG TPA: phosphoribosylaminoimidazolesuccinocarboxamide synthase [Actinobacteria bacterium]|jgi:phosphoribosylaminoimidazole-succinocarboxamide synthase|nr:phosphoribosylaminoimidazolesuccinocarboxamide synthase [Actinomycetota bacterium]
MAELHAQGKVRDIYEAGDDLLLVATDRISAFDVVLPTPIPDKGRVLTGVSLHWFELTKNLVANHLLTADVSEYPAAFADRSEELAGRSMLVKRAQVVPMECVARGYITGSGWKDYQRSGQVCGIRLPEGLRESERLPEPIFTPTTKATAGHDLPLTPEEAAELVGRGLAERLKELTLSLYEFGAEHAQQRGIILADTKFEFGFADGELILIDEVLTPDSSRFWPADRYEPGHGQPSFDKQYVRDWLDASGWDHEPPPPELPTDVVEQTVKRYREAYERITGETFDAYLSRMAVAAK